MDTLPRRYARPRHSLTERAQHRVLVISGPDCGGRRFGVWSCLPTNLEGNRFPACQGRWLRQMIVQRLLVRDASKVDDLDTPANPVEICASSAVSPLSVLRLSFAADAARVYTAQMTATLGPQIWNLTGWAPYRLHTQNMRPDSMAGSRVSAGVQAKKLIGMLISPRLASIYCDATRIAASSLSMKRMLIERGAGADEIEDVYKWDHLPEVARSQEPANKSGLARLPYADIVSESKDVDALVRAVGTPDDSEVPMALIVRTPETEIHKHSVSPPGDVTKPRMLTTWPALFARPTTKTNATRWATQHRTFVGVNSRETKRWPALVLFYQKWPE